MKKVEIQFLDKYKELDKICGAMFNVKTGVSEYIATMEKCASAGEQNIPNWKNNYKLLKHLRWIRNKIAHEEESPCTKEDLANLKSFIKLIKKEKDPVTLLYYSKNKKAKQAKSMYKVSATCFLIVSLAEYITSFVYFLNGNHSSGVTWLCIGSAMLCVAAVQTNFSKNKK